MNERRLSQYFLPATDSAADARIWSRTAERLAQADRRRRPFRAFAFGALLAAAVCAVYAIAWFRGSHSGFDAGLQVVELADGSRMELTPNDHVEVAVVTPERVELNVQRGRAKFRVAKNPARAFVTRAAGHTITVKGTVYSVELAHDTVEVKVDEGVVEVARDDGTGRWLLHAGERWSSTQRPGPIGEAKPEPSPVEPPPADTAAPETQPEQAASAEPSAAPKPGAGAAAPSADANAAAALFHRAQEARLAGRSQEAAKLLNELLQRYPNDPRAGLAAFELGRIRLDSMDDPNGALDALAQAEKSGAAFEEQVAARRVQALERAGDLAGCRTAKEAFLKRFPNGTFAAVVAQRCRGK